MLENELNAPCRALMLPSALVHLLKNTTCKLLNPTEYELIQLRKGTPIGPLVPVTVVSIPADEPLIAAASLPIDEMRKALELKGISLKDTALRGRDLNN